MGRKRSRSREHSSSTRHRSRSLSCSRDRHSSHSSYHKGDHYHSKHHKKHSKKNAHRHHHHHRHHHGDSESSGGRAVEISIGKDDLKKVLGNEVELFLANKREDEATSDSDASSADSYKVDKEGAEVGRVKVGYECGTENCDKVSTQLKIDSPLSAFEGRSNLKGPMKIVLKGLKNEGIVEKTGESTYSRSRSRSHSPQWPKQKHRSGRHSSLRQNSRSRSRDRSFDRAWDRMTDRSRDQLSSTSRDRLKRRLRDSSRDRRSRDRSRDRSGDRSRRRSRDHSRDRSGDRSRRRSRDHSRDRSGDRSRRRSRDWSRSRDRSRRRSRDHSRDRSGDRSRRSLRDRLRENRRSRLRHRRSSSSDEEHSYGSRTNQQQEETSQSKAIPVLSKKTTEINEYTSFCQQISSSHYFSVLTSAQQCATEIAAVSEVESGVMASEVPSYRDPFAINTAGSAASTNLVFHGSVWKTPTQAVLDGAEPSSVGIAREKDFPVSDGIQHHAVEGVGGQEEEGCLPAQVSEEINVSELVMMRMCLEQRLSSNPIDYEAQQQLQEVELKMKHWSNSSFKMGQYTGNATLTPITKEKHNTGLQAWVKRDMFQNLKPVGDGFGARMLRKLGWKEGQPLGKSGIGRVEPVADEVKLDRKCLAADDELAKQRKAKPQTFYPNSIEPEEPSQPPSTPSGGPVCTTGCYVGKHPVSALNELCARKKWTIQYELVAMSGPPHSRNFKYQVTLPVGSFQSDKMCGNKKLAKAEAAMACLKEVGLA